MAGEEEKVPVAGTRVDDGCEVQILCCVYFMRIVSGVGKATEKEMVKVGERERDRKGRKRVEGREGGEGQRRERKAAVKN